MTHAGYNDRSNFAVNNLMAERSKAPLDIPLGVLPLGSSPAIVAIYYLDITIRLLVSGYLESGIVI